MSRRRMTLVKKCDFVVFFIWNSGKLPSWHPILDPSEPRTAGILSANSFYLLLIAFKNLLLFVGFKEFPLSRCFIFMRTH